MHHDLSPRTPPGWEADEGRLLRFADPSGAAIAWFAPEFGGNCIGYAVRRAGGWAQIIHAAGPQVLRESPTRFGIPILFPFPGHVRGSRYTWAGAERQLPPNNPDGRGYVHGFAQFHPWRVERDGPDGLFAEFSTLTDLPDRAAVGYPFAVRLRLAFRLAQGAVLAPVAIRGLILAPVARDCQSIGPDGDESQDRSARSSARAAPRAHP